MDLSLKERDRISVLRQVCEDRALPEEMRQRALEVAGGTLYRDFGPTLLAEHLERSFEVRVSPDTLRGWMLEAGLWKRRRRRARHRSRRPRRGALGEPEQWDSSVHAWLEDRAGEFVLISIHDDATSRLMTARFVERDDGAENRRAIIEHLRLHGRPLAVYTDHAGHFGQWLEKKGERTETIISRALGELGVELILAGSPQAKGRVERTFGTARTDSSRRCGWRGSPAAAPAGERPAKPRRTARKPAKPAPDHPARANPRRRPTGRGPAEPSAPRRRPGATESPRKRRRPTAREMPRKGRARQRNDRLGVPPTGRGPGPAQRDKIRTPDLRAGQAPSLRSEVRQPSAQGGHFCFAPPPDISIPV